MSRKDHNSRTRIPSVWSQHWFAFGFMSMLNHNLRIQPWFQIGHRLVSLCPPEEKKSHITIQRNRSDLYAIILSSASSGFYVWKETDLSTAGFHEVHVSGPMFESSLWSVLFNSSQSKQRSEWLRSRLQKTPLRGSQRGDTSIDQRLEWGTYTWTGRLSKLWTVTYSS